MRLNDLIKLRHSELAKATSVPSNVGLSAMEWHDLEEYPEEWHQVTPVAALARLCSGLGIDLAEFIKNEFPDLDQGVEIDPSELPRFCISILGSSESRIRELLDTHGIAYQAAHQFCVDPKDYAERVPIDGLLPVLVALNLSPRSFLRFLAG